MTTALSLFMNELLNKQSSQEDVLIVVCDNHSSNTSGMIEQDNKVKNHQARSSPKTTCFSETKTICSSCNGNTVQGNMDGLPRLTVATWAA
jgi:hypothetical protein